MSAPLRAAVQGDKGGRGPGTAPWSEHLSAWDGYNRMYYGGNHNAGQSAECIHDRGGFSYSEMVTYLGRPPTGWEPK